MAAMSRRSPARRLLGLLGVLLLLGGVAAAVVLFLLGPRSRDSQIDELARGAVGCVTPLVFTETGSFYVFQEVAGPQPDSPSCPPQPRGDAFAVAVEGPAGAVELIADHSEAYNANGAVATSIGRIEISETGTYRLTVTGPDTGVRAAVGPDPDDVIGSYRTWALIAGLGGVIAGLVLLVGSSLGGTRRPALADEPAGTAAFPAPPFPSTVAPATPMTAEPTATAPSAWGQPTVAPTAAPTAIDPLLTPPVLPAPPEQQAPTWSAPTGDERRG